MSISEQNINSDNKRNYGYLLLSFIAFFLISPLVLTTHYGTSIVNLFFTIILIANVYAIRHHRNYLYLAVILSILSIIGHWTSAMMSDNRLLGIANLSISIVFFILTTFVVIQYILKERKVNAGTLLGAICAYLLLGITWSLIYSLIYRIAPTAFYFIHPVKLQANATFEYFIYYSFVTLTTLGYGDITPISSIAKSFAWMEAATGQIYLTIWIAQLVGTYIRK